MPGSFRKFAQRLQYRLEAALFLSFMGLFRIIGLPAASAVGGFIGRNIFSRLPPDRTARANILASFPEKSEEERDQIRKSMWDNLGRVVAEYAHLDKFSSQGKDPRVTLSILTPDPPQAYPGRALLFLSAHIANWEIMPILAEQHGLDGAIVWRPPNNPYIADWIARQRSINGPRSQIAKHSAMRPMFAQLRSQKALYMLVDQKLREGIAVPFFGRDAMTTPAPAALAIKTGGRIIMVCNRRVRGSRFHVTVTPGPEYQLSGDEKQDTYMLTALITARIEEMIRKDPGQWLWIHNRWPTASEMVQTPGSIP